MQPCSPRVQLHACDGFIATSRLLTTPSVCASAKPTPLDLRHNTVIDELPFKSPITKSWSRAK